MNCPVTKLFDSKFVRVFDLQYAKGMHYYDATRHPQSELVALKTDEEYRAHIADGVSLCVILKNEGEEDRILLNREFRYPLGRFVTSVPAGLIDEEDKAGGREQASFTTACRELTEETGLTFTEEDEIGMLNPCLFSSPGITDEANAIVRLVLRNKDLSAMGHGGSVGTELFDGFVLANRSEARKLMSEPLSVQTWICLAAFVFGL